MEEGAGEGEGGTAERHVRVPWRPTEDVGEMGGRDTGAQEENQALVGLVFHGGGSCYGLR